MSFIASEQLFQRIRKSQPLTRLIFGGVAAYLLSMPVLSWGISNNDARIVWGWIGFVLLTEGMLAISAILLAREGQPTRLMPLAWVGAFLIAAGIWSDVLATVFNTPDLARECNPIVIFLRENGFSLWLQYLVGFTAQFLLTVISCAFWVAFVHHLSQYKALIRAMRPQSLLEFIWASFGGQTYFAKTEKLKVSRSYRLIWWLVLPRILPFDRFYLALEWMNILSNSWETLGLVSFSQTAFVGVLLLSSLIYDYFEHRDVLRSDPAFTRRANQANLKGCLIRLSLIVVGTCVLACFSGFAYLWATREPEYLTVRTENAPQTMPLNTPFPITFIIQNTGAKEAAISKIQATVWLPDESAVSQNLLFVLALPPASVNTYGPQTTLEYQNMTLAPGETLRVELWFIGIEPGKVLLKTGIYSGWREKMTEPIPLTLGSP